MRTYVFSALVAASIGLAGAEPAQAQDAASALGVSGSVAKVSDEALSGVAGDQVADSGTQVTSNNSGVGVPTGVTTAPTGTSTVTRQQGGVRIMGVGLSGTRTRSGRLF